MADALPRIASADLRARFGMAGAIGALEDFLRQGAPVEAPQRTVAAFGRGQLVTMPAGGGDAAGVKVVTIQPDNPSRGLPLIHSVYLLIDADTLAPVAILDGGELTRLRTAAVSAVATRYLAREDTSRLLVFGAGVQAEAHVLAMREVRPIEQVWVAGRSASADALVAQLAQDTGLTVVRGSASDVSRADIICTCTSAREPLFDGRALQPGIHINAIGAYQPDTREVDTTTVTSSRVFVEDRGAVLGEAGDLRIPIEAGDFDPSRIAGDLPGLVSDAAGRRSASEITLFKSAGVAWEDLAVAKAAWEQLRTQ